MPAERFHIEPDISQAHTLPSRFYSDSAYHELCRAKIFRRTWQWIADSDAVKIAGQCHPVNLLPGCLDEPILLTRDREDRVHCVSNVCTHRGTIVCEHGGVEKSLVCRYHGRRFDLDGTFRYMPEFEGVKNFPSAEDNLSPVPFGSWNQDGAGSGVGPHIFASVAPAVPLQDVLSPMTERLAWLPLHEFRFDAVRSRDYMVNANWALYVENYLEGLHIPFIHSALNETIDYGQYATELFKYCNLQLGIAKAGEPAFDLPAGSPDHGRSVAAYYWWLFPNMMFNFYPWGLSINLVQPLAQDRTRVKFLSYVWQEQKLGHGAGAGLDRVEREDESVVEAVQRGTRSSFYSRGRYSPAQEKGPHHFHRLVAQFLFENVDEAG